MSPVPWMGLWTSVSSCVPRKAWSQQSMGSRLLCFARVRRWGRAPGGLVGGRQRKWLEPPQAAHVCLDCPITGREITDSALRHLGGSGQPGYF